MAVDAQEQLQKTRAALVSAFEKRSNRLSSKENADLIVIFSGRRHITTLTRINLFQVFFESETGIYPEVIDIIPACVRVRFRFPSLSKEEKSSITEFINTKEFTIQCQILGIRNLLYRSNLFSFKKLSEDDYLDLIA